MKIFDFLGNILVKKDEQNKMEIKFIERDSSQSLEYKLTAYYLATSYIKAAIKNTKLKIYDGQKEIKDHLYFLWNKRPNPNENVVYFKDKLLDMLFTKGEVLVVPIKNNLYIADCYSLEEGYTNENIFYDIYIGEDYIYKKKAKDVFFFKLEQQEIKRFLFNMFSDYDNIMDSAIASFVETNGIKYKLKINNVDIGTKTEGEKYNKFINDSLTPFLSSKKGILPEYEDYNLQRFDATQTGNTTDILSLKKDAFETAAEAFHIPVGLLYGNVTNTNDLITAFLTFSVKPILEMICSEIDSKFYTEDEIKKGMRTQFEYTDIIFKDMFLISDKIEKVLSGGIENIDGIREKLGELPRNTKSSQTYWMTKNYGPIDEVLNSSESTEGGDNSEQKVLRVGTERK